MHLVYRETKYKRITMNIRGDAPFYDVLNQVNHLNLPHCSCKDEYIRYAILELLSNSLRAHKEKAITDIIRMELFADKPGFKISIKDKGGGFDLTELPYNIETPIPQIDVHSRDFQIYREKNHYTRFGMGLLIAMQLFPEFNIRFYTETLDDAPWSPGEIVGTVVTMGMRWNNEGSS